jgi:outer membrane protein assembly factor BamB
VYLWRDAAQVYLAAKESEIPGGVQVGQAAPAFVPGSGLRQLPLNGMVYAFDPKTGDLRWRTEAFHQTLLLDPLQDQPVLWFAGRNTSWSGGGGNRVVMLGISVRVIDKRTGKFLYDHQEGNQNLQLLTVATNPDTGTSELLGVGLKVTAAVER